MRPLNHRASTLRRRVWRPLAWSLLLGACTRHTPIPQSRSTPEVWIRHVHVVDPVDGTIRHDQAVGIADGVIRAIIPSGNMPFATSARVIDGGGHFAIPGLWDAHVHLLQGDDASAERDAGVMLSFGITHVRDMGSSLDARTRFLERIASPGVAAPRMIGAGPTLWAFSLPYGDTQQQVLVTDTAETEAAVSRLAEAGVDFIKVYAGFDSTRLPRLMRAAAQHQLPVVGHAQPGMSLATQATLGLRTIEHLDFDTFQECMTPGNGYFDRVIAARFRNSGEAIPAIYAEFANRVDTPDCQTRLRSAALAGLVLTPTLTATFMSRADGQRLRNRLPEAQRDGCDLYLRQFDGVSDEVGASMVQARRRLVRLVAEAGIPLLAGTDATTFCAAPGASLVLELQMLADGGLSPLAVLQAATSLPARVFTSLDRFGVLAVGKQADLVLLSENPLTSALAYASPVGVYTRGRWYDAGALSALRQRE